MITKIKSILRRIKRALKGKLGYFPTHVYNDVYDYKSRCEDHNVIGIDEITSSEVFNLKLPRFSNVHLPERFEINHFKLIPKSYYSNMKNCTVGMVEFRVGVITEDNGLILDLSPDHAKKKIHPFLSYDDCRAQKTLKGKTLVLAAPAGKGNYYHWMFHVMGRLSVLKSLEKNWSDFDNIVVNKTYAKFQENSIKDFGFKEEQLVYLDNYEFLKVEEGYYPSYLYFSKAVPHFLKRHYLKDKNLSEQNVSKIYISRRRSSIRKLLNEDSVVEFLVNECGYKEVFMEDYTIEEQAMMMYNSSHVIAPHGAGVPNIVFCRENTQVLEILPYTWINVIYWIYAEFQSLNYGVYMAGEDTGDSNGYLDYSVDIESFKVFVKQNGY